MASTCYIYTLHASNDPMCRPRYVGFTRFLDKRTKQHTSGKEKGRKGEWAREVIRSGASVVLKVVQVFFSDDIEERGVIEATWINYFREKFPDLVNDKGGGGGLANCSPERSAKIRSAALKRFQNPAAIEKNRQAIIQYYKSPGAKEKSREAALRRYSNPSEIEKVSRVQRRRFSDLKELENNRRRTFLISAKRDIFDPPTTLKQKRRLACLKWKAKQTAKRQGIEFDEGKWLADFQSTINSVRAEVLQNILDEF